MSPTMAEKRSIAREMAKRYAKASKGKRGHMLHAAPCRRAEARKAAVRT